MPNKKNIPDNMIGRVFGKLKVLEQTDYVGKEKRTGWKCVCSCDPENPKYKTASTSDLLRGKNTSCGCANVEQAIQKLNKINSENQKSR